MKSKYVFLSMTIVVMTISEAAFANNKCLPVAEEQAKLFYAKENQLIVESIQIDEPFFHSEDEGILYYGVRVENENLNVGLSKKDCCLSIIDIVTDEFE